MTRLDTIKQLLKEKPPNIHIEEAETKQKIDETYVKRLELGQRVVTNLLTQADEAINKLEMELADMNVDLDNQLEPSGQPVVSATIGNNAIVSEQAIELELKRQALAMYNTYAKIPFSPDKNDVITIASASTVIHSLLDQNLEASRVLGNNVVVDEQIGLLKSSIREYKLLQQEIDLLTEAKEDQLACLRASQEDKVTESSVQLTLDAKLEEAEKNRLKLLRYFDVALESYLRAENIQDSEDTGTLSSLLLEMVQGGQKWVGLPKNSPEYDMIQTLLLNNVIIDKQHPDANMVYIALRTAFQ